MSLVARVRRHLRPLLPSSNDYRQLPRTWRTDLVAGVTVGIVALPLALAFGVSSGAGAEAGLVTAVIAGFIAAVFGGSNVQVSGPTGAMVVVLGPIVAIHGTGAIATVSIMAGVIVVIVGLARLGRIVSFIPWPVIEGFTLGIAMIIFVQQIPGAIGVRAGDSTNAILAAAESLAGARWPEVLWPVATVTIVAAIMLAAPRIHRKLPGSIVAIVLVTVVAVLTAAPLAVIGELPSSLPVPSLPILDPVVLQALVAPAFTVAALAAIESLLSARVASSISDTGPYEPDRELFGQGLASIASGFFGGMPATGAIARTAVNIRSGGRTRLSAIVHAVVLLAVVYLASGLVEQIPLAALSGVLMVTAGRMVSVEAVGSVIGSTRSDTLTFLVTVILTVSLDLIYAVGVGIAAAAFFALRHLARSGGVHREELPVPAQVGDERIALLRVDGALFFGAADRVLERVTSVRDVSVVILRLSQLQALDATGAKVLTEIIRELELRGITVLVKGIQPVHLRVATRVGVISALRHGNHLFTGMDAAAAHARSHVARAVT